MVDTRLYEGTLCETYSTENRKLLQVDTNTLYGASCIDAIKGYYTDGKPYSRYTYIETDEYDEDESDEGAEIELETTDE